MGSRLSNTSWCWSPRKRAPEHAPPPPPKKSDVQLDYERQERELTREWEEAHRIGNTPDLLSLDGWTDTTSTAR